MAIFTHETHGLVEEIGEAAGWVTIKAEDGSEQKVRRASLTEVVLTDEDDESKERHGDVFPAGVRDSYERGKTPEGAAYLDSGDDLAVKMRGWELQDVAKAAAEICGERTAQGWLDFYGDDRKADGKNPLNEGMVRMNLGNRIRGAIKKAAATAATAAKAEAKAEAKAKAKEAAQASE